MNRTTSQHRQQGYVLVTSLIFLMVLTLIAITAMDMTSMESRMSNNAALKARSLEGSESLRISAGDIVDAHAYNGGWPKSMTGGTVPNHIFDTPITAGLTVLDKDSNGAPDELVFENDTGESLATPSTLVADITLKVDGNSDGDYVDDNDTQATMSVYRIGVGAMVGGQPTQVAGYEGIGKAAAGGGASLYFDLRSRGLTAGGAMALTGSEYRHIIKR